MIPNHLPGMVKCCLDTLGPMHVSDIAAALYLFDLQHGSQSRYGTHLIWVGVAINLGNNGFKVDSDALTHFLKEQGERYWKKEFSHPGNPCYSSCKGTLGWRHKRVLKKFLKQFSTPGEAYLQMKKTDRILALNTFKNGQRLKGIRNQTPLFV